MDLEKAQLLEALCRKGLALIEGIERQGPSGQTSAPADASQSKSSLKDVDQVYFEIVKLTKGDPVAEAVAGNKLLCQLLERHAIVRKEPCRAIKLLLRVAADGKGAVSVRNPDTDRRVMQVIKDHRPDLMFLHDFLKRCHASRYRKTYSVL